MCIINVEFKISFHGLNWISTGIGDIRAICESEPSVKKVEEIFIAFNLKN